MTHDSAAHTAEQAPVTIILQLLAGLGWLLMLGAAPAGLAAPEALALVDPSTADHSQFEQLQGDWLRAVYCDGA